LDYAKHTLAIEGRTLTKEGEELIKRRLKEEITHDEFIQLAKDLAYNRCSEDP